MVKVKVLAGTMGLNSKAYERGTVLDLSKEEADRLEKCGSVERIIIEHEPAPAKPAPPAAPIKPPTVPAKKKEAVRSVHMDMPSVQPDA